jgi:hypothetical protein
MQRKKRRRRRESEIDERRLTQLILEIPARHNDHDVMLALPPSPRPSSIAIKSRLKRAQ